MPLEIDAEACLPVDERSIPPGYEEPVAGSPLDGCAGNFPDGTLTDRDGRLLRQGDGVALESQRYPDARSQPPIRSRHIPWVVCWERGP